MVVYNGDDRLELTSESGSESSISDPNFADAINLRVGRLSGKGVMDGCWSTLVLRWITTNHVHGYQLALVASRHTRSL